MSHRLAMGLPGPKSTVLALFGAVLLAACSSSGSSPSPAASSAASASASAAPSAAASAAAPSPSASAAAPSPTASSAAPSASTAASGVPVAVDPCQVVTQSEASKLAGVSYGAGKSETLSGGSKMCTYGAQTTDVFNVVVAQASSPAAAQADWAQEQAKAQAEMKKAVPPGVNFSLKLNDTSVAGADKAATATVNESISGVTLEISAIYLLKGPTFVSFSDLTVGHTAPSASDLETQAQVSLGRVP